MSARGEDLQVTLAKPFAVPRNCPPQQLRWRKLEEMKAQLADFRVNRARCFPKKMLCTRMCEKAQTGNRTRLVLGQTLSCFFLPAWFLSCQIPRTRQTSSIEPLTSDNMSGDNNNNSSSSSIIMMGGLDFLDSYLAPLLGQQQQQQQQQIEIEMTNNWAMPILPTLDVLGPCDNSTSDGSRLCGSQTEAVAQSLGITEDQLRDMDYSELEMIMTHLQLGANEVNEVKDARRRLKNRMSAGKSSQRRRVRTGTLEQQNNALCDRITQLEANNTALTAHVNALTQQNAGLQHQASLHAQERQAMMAEIVRLQQLVGHLTQQAARAA